MSDITASDEALCRAYAIVGRLVVIWANIDQAITRSLWRRTKSGPFPPAVPPTFPQRWASWSQTARQQWPSQCPLSWDEFEREHAHAANVRNALAHWITDVATYEAGRYCVTVQPHQLTDWRRTFRRWWERVRVHPHRQRHPGPPSGRSTTLWDWQLDDLLQRWQALLALTSLLDRNQLTGHEQEFEVLEKLKPAHLA